MIFYVEQIIGFKVNVDTIIVFRFLTYDDCRSQKAKGRLNNERQIAAYICGKIFSQNFTKHIVFILTPIINIIQNPQIEEKAEHLEKKNK